MVNVIISYSTRDENGNKYAKRLADDLYNYYGVKACVDMEGYRCFVGKPWLDGFLEHLPEHDYYILVVTETFGTSNAMTEFETAKNCPRTCQGVCGRDKAACKLKGIIPCFFIDPSDAPASVRAISGIREFYTHDYYTGFNELIRRLFPPLVLTSLELSVIGEIIEFCKELEKHLNFVKLYHSKAVEALNKPDHEAAKDYIGFIERELDEICLLYRRSPNPVKSKLEISVLKEIKDITDKAKDNVLNIKTSKLVKTEKLIKELNKLLREDIATKLKNEVRINA